MCASQSQTHACDSAVDHSAALQCISPTTSDRSATRWSFTTFEEEVDYGHNYNTTEAGVAAEVAASRTEAKHVDIVPASGRNCFSSSTFAFLNLNLAFRTFTAERLCLILSF